MSGALLFQKDTPCIIASEMTALLVFIVIAAISFAGSIHIGPVNLAVIKVSLKNDFRSALYVSIGGSLPELIYAAIAVMLFGYLNMHPGIISFLDKLVAPFFIITGIGYFISPVNTNKKRKRTARPLLNGFLAGMFNPQLLPFWLGVLLYIKDYFPINTFSEKIAFITGTATGAFLLLYLYAFLALRYRHIINTMISSTMADRLIGSGMLGMAALKMFG